MRFNTLMVCFFSSVCFFLVLPFNASAEDLLNIRQYTNKNKPETLGEFTIEKEKETNLAYITSATNKASFLLFEKEIKRPFEIKFQKYSLENFAINIISEKKEIKISYNQWLYVNKKRVEDCSLRIARWNTLRIKVKEDKLVFYINGEKSYTLPSVDNNIVEEILFKFGDTTKISKLEIKK
ncbi:hypothetical protein [Desulfotalea psychrophila]|uniref:3-keto-disaccharide hydrolase domain-containing protein n=1 Tax=Desulfotalea psychrophila (strain LSv54 / DSM 12343) TaxID=177439 RepID=Q6AI73_DESPS|nr:hypothetical protein [Desulfotalea psychrophila]CAG37856.1 unknown protein [Desulfotalea psychrophila LSv54]